MLSPGNKSGPPLNAELIPSSMCSSHNFKDACRSFTKDTQPKFDNSSRLPLKRDSLVSRVATHKAAPNNATQDESGIVHN